MHRDFIKRIIREIAAYLLAFICFLNPLNISNVKAAVTSDTLEHIFEDNLKSLPPFSAKYNLTAIYTSRRDTNDPPISCEFEYLIDYANGKYKILCRPLGIPPDNVHKEYLVNNGIRIYRYFPDEKKGEIRIPGLFGSNFIFFPLDFSHMHDMKCLSRLFTYPRRILGKIHNINMGMSLEEQGRDEYAIQPAWRIDLKEENALVLLQVVYYEIYPTGNSQDSSCMNFWLDPAKNHLMIKYQKKTKGKEYDIEFEQVTESFLEKDGKPILPKTGYKENFSREYGSQGRYNEIIRFTLDEGSVKWNPSFPDDMFTFAFPKGTKIYDRIPEDTRIEEHLMKFKDKGEEND